MRRRRLAEIPKSPPTTGGIYFSNPKVETFSSGCTLLDCALGGGWAYERIANIIGDKSSGKTLLAIEACANFIRANPEGKVYYLEAEAAFDKRYAESLGLPLGHVKFPGYEKDFPEGISTVEDWFEHLERVLQRTTKNRRVLYIVDSLDALSDRQEAESKIDEKTYGMTKQKRLSTLFRRLVRRLSSSGVTVLIVSQVRDAIGVTFGKKHVRSGGKGLDFYASHAVWLAHLSRIVKTKDSVKRVIGVLIKAKIEKNKVGVPFREATFPLLFGYGVEDLWAGLSWLEEVGQLQEVRKGFSKDDARRIQNRLEKLGRREYRSNVRAVRKAVKRVWRRIEKKFLPVRRKYE